MGRFRARLAITNPELAERVHSHLFRHSFARHAINQGAERAAVKDMLGQASDAMTRR